YNGAYAVYGAIGSKYSAMGGTGSTVGFPTYDQSSYTSITGATGATQTFESGEIDTSNYGAFFDYGAIRSGVAYNRSNGNNCLGFPTDDEYNISTGQQQDFEGGSVTSTAAGSYNVACTPPVTTISSSTHQNSVWSRNNS